MRSLPIMLLVLTTATFNLGQAADVYRWTDENGVTHFSDAPPSNTNYERVSVRTGVTSAVAEQTEPEAAAETSAADLARAERCRIARQNLATLSTGLASRVGEDGVARNLTVEEMDEQRDLNERAVTANCTPD
jgi:hypothetical protein